jgi:DNA ligase D-like protein (predicted 3'-phosphoesterase)
MFRGGLLKFLIQNIFNPLIHDLSMSLKTYVKKRNLKKSGEPKPKIKNSSSKNYVVQEHHAQNLHWDLRLEIKGVLKSWALPKKPPRAKGIKRLAIQVEDHPLEYANFKGIIPQGNYGAGEVEIWDNGTYELIEKTPKKIEINLHGKKLKGNYVLIKTGYGDKKKGWLFFKTS